MEDTEAPASLDEARKRRKVAAPKPTTTNVAKSVRKHRLSPKEIATIEKKYGLETDGLPARQGRSRRARVHDGRGQWDPDPAWHRQPLAHLRPDHRPLVGRPDHEPFRFNGYVIQVGTLMLQNATTLRLKLDAGAVPDARRSRSRS